MLLQFLGKKLGPEGSDVGHQRKANPGCKKTHRKRNDFLFFFFSFYTVMDIVAKLALRKNREKSPYKTRHM
jgi:hypothetical protein